MKTFKFILVLSISFFLLNNSYSQNKAIKITKLGKGNPVILLPGFTCPAEVWKQTTNQLKNNKQCHIVEYAGFRNIAPLDTLWMHSIKKELVNYVKKLNNKELTIIGHSMGGTLGLWLTTQKDVKIKKLIVVDALPCLGALMIPNYKPENILYNSPYNSNLLKMDTVNFRAMVANMVKYMVSSKQKQKLISNWSVNADRKTYVYLYTDLLKMDLRNELNKINCKVLIIAADNFNKQMIQNNYNRQYKNLKNKTIIYAQNSFHFIMFDKFDWFIKKINLFIN